MKRYFWKETYSGEQIILFFQNERLCSFADPSPGNTDWEEYQQWLAEGNTAEPWNPEGQ